MGNGNGIATKFERLAKEYAAAKRKADEAKLALDAYKLTMQGSLDIVDDIRQDIYARMLKNRVSVGTAVHTSCALLTLSEGPLSVEVVDMDRVPLTYVRQPEPQVSKADVLRLWRDSHKKVPGTRIVIGEPVLSIRL